MIEEAADFGLRSIADVALVVSADRELPEVADGATIARVATLDDHALESGLVCKRELLAAERALSVAPGVRDLSMEALNRGSAIAIAVRDSHLLKMTPAAAYTEAARTVLPVRRLVATLNAIVRSLGKLGLDQRFPARGLMAVHKAVRAVSDTPAKFRRIVWDPSDGVPALKPLEAEWTKPVERETFWRNQLSSDTPRTRSPHEELLEAAATLRKRGIGKMLAAARGSAKAANETLRKLGIDPHARPTADELEELAAVIRARQQDRRHIATLPCGAAVLTGLRPLTPSTLDTLADDLHLFDAYAERPKALNAQPGEWSIGELINKLEHSLSVADAVLSIDPDRLFVGIDLPLATIAEMGQIEQQRRRLAANLEEHSLARDLTLFGDDAAIDAALGAIAWVRAVRRQGVPESLRYQLLSADAPTARSRLTALANQAAPTVARLQAIMAKMEAEHEVQNLACDAPADLVARLDTLLERFGECAVRGGDLDGRKRQSG